MSKGTNGSHMENGTSNNGHNKNDGESPSKKKTKTTSVLNEILSSHICTEEHEKALQESYWNGTPYHHARMENLFHVDFLTSCKEQIKQNSKVNFKETDLFRVYQSIDLANLEPNSELAIQMPAVMKLREVLYSQEWRSFMERVTKLPPGTLSSQVDCACNCHAPGCHLLCHDDVIGTRKISYILYLTEPDWKEEEGGALELYDSYLSNASSNSNNKDYGDDGNQKATTAVATNGNKSSKSLSDDEAARREPETCPFKTLMPLFNSMAFFVVEPGVSFHAVQEVLGERPRLSIQGWYHAANAPDHVENATLNRLKEAPQSSINTTAPTQNKDTTKADEEEEDPFIPLKDERVQPLEKVRKQRAANADKLLDSDRDYLALYVNETYLTKAAMEEIRQRFEEDSSVQFRHFFRTSWTEQVKKAFEGHDEEPRPKVGEDAYYQWGVSDEWKLVGPPHKQRYLQYQEKEQDTGSSNGNRGTTNGNHEDPLAMALPPQTKSAGYLMAQLKQKVMQSPAFGRYLNYITSLGFPLGYKGQIRRFRPGLDYTVAHYGILTQKSVLDATICFAAGTGGVNPPASIDGSNEDEEQPTATAAAVKVADDESQPGEEDMDEADLLWQSDDVGGFECYIEADDYENNFTRDGDGNLDDDVDDSPDDKEKDGDKAAASVPVALNDPAEEYNEDDDTNLLSVSASNNTLSLVFRDPGTMRFIKYVGSRAPSSRWDISMEYQVPEDDSNDGKPKRET